MDSIRRYSSPRQGKLNDEHTKDYSSSHHQKRRVGCGAAGGSSAEVEVDNVPRKDWSFHVFPLENGYAACVARGPPSACSASGQAVGVVNDPRVGSVEGAEGAVMDHGNIHEGEGSAGSQQLEEAMASAMQGAMRREMERGLALPQIEFEAVRLVDILRGVGAATLEEFISLGTQEKKGDKT